jgi:hypothetical protein
MLNRRDVLKGIGAASVVAATAGCSRAVESDGDEDLVDFLFVQNAQDVSLNDGSLRLEGVSPDTLYFSDRPDRIVGRVTTKEYVEHWSVGGNSFAEDPPNAVLSIVRYPLPLDIVVVLRRPRLEGADLVYDVDVLDGEQRATGEAAALFIDVIGRPMTPLSVAGVRRRTRRRTRRRVTR